MYSIKLTDNELVTRFISGDDDAINQLILRYKDRVFTYILINVKSDALAQDIFQDTFIKVIRSLRRGKYFDDNKFLSWVIRIAHNLCIDHFRKEKNQKVYSNDDYEYDLLNSTKFSEKTIEDKMIEDQVHKEIRVLIDELPDDQKEVILLRHYANMSFKEIAEETNVSINTALGRMRYARLNLKRLIEERNISLSYV